jgi:hypothetical protein
LAAEVPAEAAADEEAGSAWPVSAWAAVKGARERAPATRAIPERVRVRLPIIGVFPFLLGYE